jgi:hypothetical protein
MSPSRVAAWMFGAAVLGAWLASAAGVSRQGPSAPADERSAAPHPVDNLAADVQTQAARLRLRMDAAPAPQATSRNPFAFSPRVESAPRLPRPTAPVVEAAPAPDPEPILDLIGIAEKKVGDAVVRTVMLANEAGDVIMATTGQRVIGIYDVAVIGADAVELKHAATGATRRLVLR